MSPGSFSRKKLWAVFGTRVHKRHVLTQTMQWYCVRFVLISVALSRLQFINKNVTLVESFSVQHLNIYWFLSSQQIWRNLALSIPASNLKSVTDSFPSKLGISDSTTLPTLNLPNHITLFKLILLPVFLCTISTEILQTSDQSSCYQVVLAVVTSNFNRSTLLCSVHDFYQIKFLKPFLCGQCDICLTLLSYISLFTQISFYF